jgi:hypothetical protein
MGYSELQTVMLWLRLEYQENQEWLVKIDRDKRRHCENSYQNVFRVFARSYYCGFNPMDTMTYLALKSTDYQRIESSEWEGLW